MKSLLRERRAFTRAKEEGRPCEDVILGRPLHGRFAVSDGASISFDSRGWARALCWHFMRDTNVGPEWLDRARAQFGSRSAPSSDDWSASHAADRGSFATFLGITLTETRLLVYAIGDTVLFIVGPDGCIAMHPKFCAADFEEAPALLCSRPGISAFDDTDAAFDSATFVFEAPPGGWADTRLIAVTDALAEWVIRADEQIERLARLQRIAGHPDNASFTDWIAGVIAEGSVRRDDCAALIVQL